MAKRAVPASGLFAAAEATLIGLYDAGVLFPAVLQHVIAGFANSAIDWNTAPRLRTVDNKSLHEVVAMTMMPGRIIRNASKEFLAVIGHIGGISTAEHNNPGEPEEPDEPPEDEPDSDLINQLSGGRRRKRAAKPARKTAPSAGFNPLVHATSPRRSSKS